MAYQKTDWQPRKGVNLNRFNKSEETAEYVILTNEPDEVTEPGTLFSSENMNNIEEGIFEAHEGINAIAAAIEVEMTDEDESDELPKLSEESIPAILQVMRNCLKWLDSIITTHGTPQSIDDDDHLIDYTWYIGEIYMYLRYYKKNRQLDLQQIVWTQENKARYGFCDAN